MRYYQNNFITTSLLLLIAGWLITSPACAQEYDPDLAILGLTQPAPTQLQNVTQQDVEQILNTGGRPQDLVLNTIYQSTSKYTLGVSDIIQVDVLRHPEVSGLYVINGEGKIQYEFVGDVVVSGLTKQGIVGRLKEILGKYIIAPEVTVKIVGYNSKVVYVIGEVGAPGKIFMRGDTITVRDALVQAGLPLLSAKSKKSTVITPSETGKAKVKKVNINKLLYKGDLRENLVMKPGDTLYIPPTAMARAMRVLQPIAAPIGTSAGTARTVTTGF